MKNKHYLVFVLGFMAMLFVFYGCALMKPGIKKTKGIGESPAMTVLEKIPNIPQPDWTTSSKDYWTQNGNVYTSGSAKKYSNLKTALDEAENFAMAKLVKHTKETMLAEFRETMALQKYDAKTGEYVTDTFSIVVSTMKISGAWIKESYSEKIKETSKGNERIIYRSWVLVELTRPVYESNIQQALSNLKTVVKTNKNVKKLVDSINNAIKGKSQKQR